MLAQSPGFLRVRVRQQRRDRSKACSSRTLTLFRPGPLRGDLARFTFLLGGNDGEQFFSPGH